LPNASFDPKWTPPVFQFSVTRMSFRSTSPLLVVPALRVRQVHELVLRELRVDGNLEESSLLDGEHVRRSGDGLWIERAAAHYAQLARLLRNQHVTVREEREAPRRRQALEHRHDADRRPRRLDHLWPVGERQGIDTLEAASGRPALTSAAALSAAGGRRLLRHPDRCS
jgi:hypothetical protein